MKRTFITATIVAALSLVAVAVSPASPVSAAAPVVSVTKYQIYTGASNYTATIDQATSVAATPRDSAYLPSTTGGCVLVFHVNTRNHAKIIDSLSCPTPGTVSFRTPANPTCGSTFELTVTNGLDVTSYSDAITNPCPPPPPPAVVVAASGAMVTFTNPAGVVQTSSYANTAPALSCVYVADGPYTAQTTTRYAGIGINRYVYFWAFVQVTVAPLATVTATLVC